MLELVKPDFLEIDEVAKNFLEIIERVARGQEIVITRDAEPVAKLSPAKQIDPKNRPARKPGGAEGFEVPEEFFDPLPDDVMK